MKSVKSTAFIGVLVLLATSIGAVIIQGKTNQEEKLKNYTYAKDVAPILNKYCLNCHGTDTENPSELFMDDFASLMKGGKHGETVVPGKPAVSNLYLKMLPEPPFGKQMPRGHRKITQEEIQIIKDWIEQGAKEK
jgi:hypothetical protein